MAVNTRLMADRAHAAELDARAEALRAEYLPRAEAVDWDGLPDGFTAHRISLATEHAIVGEVAAAGPDMILLEPPELRAEVIERLQGVLA